jgi:hypothetical protein
LAVGAVAVVLAAGCGGSGGGGVAEPTRAAASAATQNPAGAADAQTDALLDAVGLRRALGARADAVYALLSRARAVAIGSIVAPTFTPPPRATTQRSGPPAAELLGFEVTTLPQLFAYMFAGFLDQATTWSAEGLSFSQTVPGTPTQPRTIDDGAQTVTTSTNMDYTPGVAGSVVTLSLTNTITQTVTDDKTHAVLATVSDVRTYAGKIDVCPGTAGDVPMSITIDIGIQSSDKTIKDHQDDSLAGRVDDSAALATVEQTSHDTSRWTSQIGTGSVDVSTTGLSYPGDATNGMSVSGMDTSHMSQPFRVTGDATTADAQRTADGEETNSWLIGPPVITAAQKLWRNGRCVVVTAPDYKAETPLKITEQANVQHTEDVDKSSETDFGVALKHRFASVPAAPVDAALSGDKSIDPAHAPAAPTTVKYIAGDQDDAKADVTLTSTSKRGIGKLVLEFAVKPKKLALSMDGALNFSFGPISLTAHVHAATATFAPVGDGTYRASLPATTSYTVTGAGCGSANGTEANGSLVFNATLVEGPDKKPLWNVTLDPNRSQVHTFETACGIPFADLPLSGAGGGLVGAMASTAGPLTLPSDGGTVHVHNSIIDMTFVATVPK